MASANRSASRGRFPDGAERGVVPAGHRCARQRRASSSVNPRRVSVTCQHAAHWGLPRRRSRSGVYTQPDRQLGFGDPSPLPSTGPLWGTERSGERTNQLPGYISGGRSAIGGSDRRGAEPCAAIFPPRSLVQLTACADGIFPKNRRPAALAEGARRSGSTGAGLAVRVKRERTTLAQIAAGAEGTLRPPPTTWSCRPPLGSGFVARSDDRARPTGPSTTDSDLPRCDGAGRAVWEAGNGGVGPRVGVHYAVSLSPRAPTYSRGIPLSDTLIHQPSPGRWRATDLSPSGSSALDSRHRGRARTGPGARAHDVLESARGRASLGAGSEVGLRCRAGLASAGLGRALRDPCCLGRQSAAAGLCPERAILGGTEAHRAVRSKGAVSGAQGIAIGCSSARRSRANAASLDEVGDMPSATLQAKLLREIEDRTGAAGGERGGDPGHVAAGLYAATHRESPCAVW
jgi:hypothetical protein